MQRSYLWQVKPTDAVSYVTAYLLTAAIGLLAAVRPAQRAASIAQADALRSE